MSKDESPNNTVARLQAIRERELDVAKAEREWAAAKDQAAECHKYYSEAVNLLRETIRETDPLLEYGEGQATGAAEGAEAAEATSLAIE